MGKHTKNYGKSPVSSWVNPKVYHPKPHFHPHPNFKVVSWGSSEDGGDNSSVQEQLQSLWSNVAIRSSWSWMVYIYIIMIYIYYYIYIYIILYILLYIYYIIYIIIYNSIYSIYIYNLVSTCFNGELLSDIDVYLKWFHSVTRRCHQTWLAGIPN